MLRGVRGPRSQGLDVPRLKTSAAGREGAKPVGPGRPRKAPGWECRQERRRPSQQQALAGGCRPAGRWGRRGRGVAAGGGGASERVGVAGRRLPGGRGLHEARPLPYAGGLPARCTSASRASASSLARPLALSLAPSRPPRSSGRAGFPHPQPPPNPSLS